jgi:glycosyltransferase involved in cell wall biosynthesis
MRIGLNLLHAQPEIGGGWNYIANLIKGLADNDDDHEFVAFVTPVSAEIVPSHRRFRQVLLPVQSASRMQRILYENTRLPGIADRMKIDVLHWFSNTHAPLSRTPSAVTVYDLLAFTPAAPWGPIKLGYLKTMIRNTVRSADVLLPISQATARDLQVRLHARADRMIVIPPVLPAVFRPAPASRVAALKRTFGIPGHYWLYVAHFYPHKNHVTLIEAYQRLTSGGSNHQWPLVLRGDVGIAQVRRQIAEAGLDGKTILLPRLNEEDLSALYTGAGALVLPSTHEGFGLPVLEAMACGCPVIAAPLPAVMETGRDAIWVVDPLSADTLCDAMHALQRDPDRAADLCRRGYERARQFRSDIVMPRLLEAYNRTACRGCANAH